MTEIKAPLTAVEQRVWDAWNALPEDTESPVKTIARDLGMDTGDVAFVVYPSMCRDCRFYSAPGVKVGECRINPPALTEDDDDRWPTVWADDFCGSFEPAS